LGCVLYLCLTGRLPYPADSADEYIKAVKVSPRQIPTTRQLRSDTPLELDSLVMGCVEPDRDRRISAIEDVMRRFANAIPDGLSLLGVVAPRFVAP
jgi:serine/threonine protein kinase